MLFISAIRFHHVLPVRYQEQQSGGIERVGERRRYCRRQHGRQHRADRDRSSPAATAEAVHAGPQHLREPAAGRVRPTGVRQHELRRHAEPAAAHRRSSAETSGVGGERPPHRPNRVNDDGQEPVHRSG